MAPVSSSPQDDLAPEVRARIDEMFGVVGDDLAAPDPHRLLGIARGADRREIKRAYFKLSKEFHPERFYGKKLGGYADRLSQIFQAVKSAFDLLSDDNRRAAYEDSLEAG